MACGCDAAGPVAAPALPGQIAANAAQLLATYDAEGERYTLIAPTQGVGVVRKILTEAVDVMEAAKPYYDAPQLTAAIADARSRINALAGSASGGGN